MQNKQNHTACLYIEPCKAQKDKARNALDKARARVFSIMCLSMCSRSLNSSPKGPDHPTTWPVCQPSFGPNAQGPSQISPLHQRILSCVQIKSAHSCVQKDGAQSISLFKKPPFKSKRHSESLCFKCSSQSSITKP
jgi:hypothetical protein